MLTILLICDYMESSAGTIRDHIFAIEQYSRHNIYVIRSLGDLPESLVLQRFDAILIHYSIVCCNDYHLSPVARQRIRKFHGLKGVFIQDEYRFIDDTVQALRQLDIQILFSVVPQTIIHRIYDPNKLALKKVTLLTGYVPEHLLGLAVAPIGDRTLDVGYRARQLSAWHGAFAMEKWWISDRFLQTAQDYDLTCDVSCAEKDRIYGTDWTAFLSNCKAVLGTESGVSVCDFSGALQREVEQYEAMHPQASFDEIHDLFLRDIDGEIVINVISPRCFEAACLKTLMILYVGDYSGRLTPWRHYVPLEKDHSNIDAVIKVLKDTKHAQAIVDCAYEEVACNANNTFQAMVTQVDQALDETFEPSMAAKTHYSPEAFKAIKKQTERTAQKIHRLDRAVIVLASLIDTSLSVLPEKWRERMRSRLRWYWRTFRLHRNWKGFLRKRRN